MTKNQNNDDKKFSFGEFIRENAFSVINIIIVIAGFAYQQGQLNMKIGGMETRLTAAEKVVNDMEKFGHPDHERRIVLLENRNDQIAKLAALQEMQNKSISDLAGVVAKDHDILIRFAAMVEQMKEKEKETKRP
jgi:hypothetical protein